MKEFVTTGKCIPSINYMVDISRQVEYAANLVRRNKYFCINRGRQYGKTTTLSSIKKKLDAEGFAVFSISFEGLGVKYFQTEETLLKAFWTLMEGQLRFAKNLTDEQVQYIRTIAAKETIDSIQFSTYVYELCKDSKVVVMIDEVDQASNYGSFIKLLGFLRAMYLSRDEAQTFQSVILASVFDIKNLRLKIRPEELHSYNSPWNIAESFTCSMELPEDGIAKMLREYKADYGMDFDEKLIAREISDWTSGYPYLVSRICQLIANPENNLQWTHEGVDGAVKMILTDTDSLFFSSITKKLTDFPQLKALLREILYNGTYVLFNPDEAFIKLGLMFGILKVADNGSQLVVSNRIIEVRLYNLFIEEDKTASIYKVSADNKNMFVKDGQLDMRLVLEKFCLYFNDIYGSQPQKFVESEGRKMFLLFMRPIINGAGNYYIESQTRDSRRTDVIIDYKSKQYIIELKVWRGEEYNTRGEIQLSEYLDYYHLDEGYMVSFSFNQDKLPGLHDVELNGKKLTEAVI